MAHVEGRGSLQPLGQAAPLQRRVSVMKDPRPCRLLATPRDDRPPQPAPRPSASPTTTSVTLQRLEALEGDPRGARHELQQPGPPLLVEGLHRLPKPPDHVAVSPAVLQPRVGLPVVQVDLVQAADDQL